MNRLMMPRSQDGDADVPEPQGARRDLGAEPGCRSRGNPGEPRLSRVGFTANFGVEGRQRVKKEGAELRLNL